VADGRGQLRKSHSERREKSEEREAGLSVYTLVPLAGVAETPHQTMVNSFLWVGKFHGG